MQSPSVVMWHSVQTAVDMHGHHKRASSPSDRCFAQLTISMFCKWSLSVSATQVPWMLTLNYTLSREMVEVNRQVKIPDRRTDWAQNTAKWVCIESYYDSLLPCWSRHASCIGALARAQEQS